MSAPVKSPSIGKKTKKANGRALDRQPQNPGDAFHFKPGHSIGYLLRMSYRSFAKALEVHISQKDIGIGQWFFLRELWEEDGLAQRELASRVGIATPTTAVAIRGMLKDGLVKQVPDTADRRKKRIYLTKKGRNLKNILLPRARDVNEVATKGFSKSEIRQFREYVERMKRNLDGG